MYDNWTLFGALYYHLVVSYFNEVMKKDMDQLLINEGWNESRLDTFFEWKVHCKVSLKTDN